MTQTYTPPSPPAIDPLAMSGCTTAYGSRRIGDLTPAPYNPRVMSASERDSLIRSLETWGFVDPVIVRAEDGLIIGGHQRVEAWRLSLSRKGLAPEEIDDMHVPVMAVSGLTEERTKLLNIALNRISGDWAHDKLAALLSGLAATLPQAELELSGFRLPEIEDYKAMLGGLPMVPGSGGGGGGPSAGGGGGDSGAPKPDDAPPEVTAEDIVAEASKRLIVEFPDGGSAIEARGILARFGMTGDKDAPDALLSALRTAARVLDGEVPEAPAKRGRKPKSGAPAA